MIAGIRSAMNAPRDTVLVEQQVHQP